MNDAGQIIKKVLITEKGTNLQEQNKYMLEVHPNANKIEIRKAIEEHFQVTVTSVNTMNYEGKRKRMRTAKYGKRSDWKRAIVTLKEGDTIDIT
jgi:large subunit ribosomal protein L23